MIRSLPHGAVGLSSPRLTGEALIQRREQDNACRYRARSRISQVTSYEAMAPGIEDVFTVLSELRQPEYELELLGCSVPIANLGSPWAGLTCGAIAGAAEIQ
jgi:hypothetical protein